MPRFTSAVVVELSEALHACYLRSSQLDEFLQTRLNQRFDDLASRYIPLKESISEIAQKANDQGWIADLIRAAAADRPQNDTLRRLLAALPDLENVVGPVPGRSHIDRPSLLCGRAPQWNEICQCAPAQVHQVLIVPGARGQDPLHFRDRVQVWLTPDPSRTMVAVHWQTPPESLDEMIEALAGALDTSADGIGEALTGRLAYQNLVLLHPCIAADFSAAQFMDYYTTWLPTLLPARGTGALKCIQPLEWSIRDGGGLLARLLGRTRERAEGRDEAIGLLTALKKRQHGLLRIIDVDELLNLEERELQQFLEGSEFPVDHQPLLLDQLLGGPQVSGYMFKTIDDYWRNIGGHP